MVKICTIKIKGKNGKTGILTRRIPVLVNQKGGQTGDQSLDHLAVQVDELHRPSADHK